jgi:hypothetical protein
MPLSSVANKPTIGCRRCQGLMVPELIEDLPEHWALHGVGAWRCVACGDITDPVIVANRESGLSQENGSKWSRLKFGGAVVQESKGMRKKKTCAVRGPR